MYNAEQLEQLYQFYRSELLDSTIPFWFPRSYDQEFGGFLLMRDADGSLFDDDKAVWIQGRATWLLSTLYNTVEPREEWLTGAKLGYDFLNKYCFSSDGKMYFHMTRDGRPIRKRRYFFSETFFVIAAAAYSKASGDQDAAERARHVFGQCLQYAGNPNLLPPKFTSVRPATSLGVPMILINTAQQLRETIGDPRCNECIDQFISTIKEKFVKPDIRCVMEQVSPNGEIIDHIDGRLLNPGHAIEGAWFILYEAMWRNNDPELIRLGCSMIDYMWERGWDSEYGGLLYYCDVYQKPVQEYWHDMKFWWPHNEAIIATLLAFLLTGQARYANMHQQVHDYAYRYFKDETNGEWFGYLHRDGRLSQTAKGNLFKGPFHLPRQEWICTQLLSQYLQARKSD